MSGPNQASKDYGQLLENWKNEFKATWDYKRKLVVFQDGNGNLYTPTTTTTTTTRAPSTVVPRNTTYSKVADVTLPQTTPKSGAAVSGTSTDLIRLIGITVGVLLCFLIIAGLCIMLCRRSRKKKKNRDLSVRRPLEGPEPEEHIYAEIEPLQRPGSSTGASGTTSDIPLPERKRRRGISSFSGLSTRIQRFFSARKSVDNHSVFYNKRNGESAMQTVSEAPEPPQRDMNGDRNRGKKVKRFESTASRRPLLDGDSQISQISQASQPSASSDVDMRNSTYIPLMKTEDGRVSGPYDTLNRENRDNENSDETDRPHSPHDYFTLQKNNAPMEEDIDEDSPVYNSGSEIVTLHEPDHMNMETIEESEAEENDGEAPASHDYFVLEPHEREKSVKAKAGDKDVSSENGQQSNTDEQKDGDKSKPKAKPRNTKTSMAEKSPSDEDESEVLSSNTRKMNEYIAYGSMNKDSADSKDDDYEISKLGEAPRPPEEKKGNAEEPEEDNDYLMPVKDKASVYVDVFPNPPPRTTSLLHDSSSDLNHKTKGPASSSVSLPTKSAGSPVRGRWSPSKSPTKSPTKSKPLHRVTDSAQKPVDSTTKSVGSPTKSAGSPTKLVDSPTKSVSSTTKSVVSPTKTVSSPTKSVGSPTKSVGSPTKSVDLSKRMSSPAKGVVVQTHSNETEV